jgi:hypothetical protein
MSPTALNILLTDNSTVVTVPISAAVRDSSQGGLFGPDVVLSDILRRGYFWNSAHTASYPVSQIKSVTYS